MHLSGGNCHDAPQGRISIENIGDSYLGIPYLMDRAYEGDKTRELCQSFGHKPVVPPKKNRINPWEYDHELYKQRNIIERLFRWLKAFRRVCTRYDKLDVCIFVNDVRPKRRKNNQVQRIVKRPAGVEREGRSEAEERPNEARRAARRGEIIAR